MKKSGIFDAAKRICFQTQKRESSSASGKIAVPVGQQKEVFSTNNVSINIDKQENDHANDITVALATHPIRKNAWLNVVKQLLP
jgi:hypothetical protein